MKIKNKMTRGEAKEEIDSFFERDKFTSAEMKKIKRLAMKFNIKLGERRKKFCKKCFSDLKNAGVKTEKGHRITRCGSCGYISRWKIKE